MKEEKKPALGIGPGFTGEEQPVTARPTNHAESLGMPLLSHMIKCTC